jgi:hypothetical protein
VTAFTHCPSNQKTVKPQTTKHFYQVPDFVSLITMIDEGSEVPSWFRDTTNIWYVESVSKPVRVVVVPVTLTCYNQHGTTNLKKI